jgi:hypothetical protein
MIDLFKGIVNAKRDARHTRQIEALQKRLRADLIGFRYQRLVFTIFLRKLKFLIC